MSEILVSEIQQKWEISQKAEETMEYLIKTNEEEYNWLKLGEELAELQELVMKKITKRNTPKEPTMDKIIEEMGDVVLRLTLIGEKHNLLDDIEARVDKKLGVKFYEYMKQGKYTGRI